MAGSTEDLARLFTLEKELWKLVKGNLGARKESQQGGVNLFLFSFLLVDLPGEVNLTDWRRVLECEDALAHVSNPLNAFQVKMMKSNVDLECGVVGWNWRCTDAI